MIYKDQLEAVYRLIEKPENWTQHLFARGKRNTQVTPNGRFAVCWCLEGALCKVLGVSPSSDAGQHAFSEFDDLCETQPAYFNDHHAHAEVLALLKSAIDRAPVRHD